MGSSLPIRALQLLGSPLPWRGRGPNAPAPVTDPDLDLDPEYDNDLVEGCLDPMENAPAAAYDPGPM